MSEEYPYLANAPIKEAVVDIQVINHLPMADLYRGPIEGFKQPVELFVAEFHIHHEEGVVRHDESRTLIGYRYESHDGRFVLQVRQQGLVTSRLAPYTNWGDLEAVARRAWDVSFAAKGLSIARLAVRYINVLVVAPCETGFINFNHYFNNAPRVPDNLNLDVKNFLTRYVVGTNEVPGGTAIINQNIEHTETGALSLILDIDIFCSFDQQNPFVGKMWQLLDQLKNEENRIFFNTMTTKALELCK